MYNTTTRPVKKQRDRRKGLTMARITRSIPAYPVRSYKAGANLHFLKEWRQIMVLTDTAGHLTACARFAPATDKWMAEEALKKANLSVELAFMHIRGLYRSLHENAAVLDHAEATSTLLPEG